MGRDTRMTGFGFRVVLFALVAAMIAVAFYNLGAHNGKFHYAMELERDLARLRPELVAAQLHIEEVQMDGFKVLRMATEGVDRETVYDLEEEVWHDYKTSRWVLRRQSMKQTNDL